MTEPTSTSQRVSSQNGPGLGFRVANAKGAPVVYITTDPNLNTLTLTITNQTGAAVILKGGAPVSEAKLAPGGPTSLYLTLSGVLDGDQFKMLEVSASGWQAQLMSGTLTNWALTPTADLALADKGTVVVTIAHLTVGGSPRPGALTLDYFNFPTVDDDSSQQTLAVQRPPSELRDLVLDVAFASTNVVYVSRDLVNPIVNTLVLSIANPSPHTPLVPPDVPWEENKPVFYLSFVYGEKHGSGALTTATLGQTIQVAPAEQTTDTWTTQQVPSQDGTYWQLSPQQHEVLGARAASRVGFAISHIITEFDPEPLPTSLYLQWAYIPGYNDGHLSLDIVKRLPASGILFFRSLTPSVIHAGSPVTLTWQSFAVRRLELLFKSGNNAIVLGSAARQIDLSMERFQPTPVPFTDTIYYLEAFDDRDIKVDSKAVPISVIASDVKIESFTVSPRVVNFAAGPVDITLTWSVTPTDRIKSLEIEGLATVTGQTSYVVQAVTAPAMYGLRAINLGGDEKIASVHTQALDKHLVGRTYRLISQLLLRVHGGSGPIPHRGGFYWSEDRLEILSPTEARYTVDTCDRAEVVLEGDPRIAPKPPRGPSSAGYPKVVTGPWSLVGSTIQVATSLGTLRFTWMEHSARGEALEFENPLSGVVRLEGDSGLLLPG